jgi:hypothetical protein
MAVVASIFCDYDPEKYQKTQELYSGLKNSKTSRIYTIFILLRRIMLVTWLIEMSSFDQVYVISFPIVVQAIHILTLMYLRPFRKTDDNLVEIINEVFFTVLLSSLAYLNSEEIWKGVKTDVYYYTLLGNNVVIILVLFCECECFTVI